MRRVELHWFAIPGSSEVHLLLALELHLYDEAEAAKSGTYWPQAMRLHAELRMSAGLNVWFKLSTCISCCSPCPVRLASWLLSSSRR